MKDIADGNKKKALEVKCTEGLYSRQLDSWYSWVVCFAGVLSNIVVCGFSYSYGILFPAILDEFKMGKAKTASVGSIAMMGFGLFGPLAGKLYQRFGARIVSFTGALICAASLIATSKTPNLYVMFLTYGGLFGIGSSFVFITVYLIVPKYFFKWRSLSMGLIAMGPGGGLFIMSPLVQVLFERLGWRGTFLAMAGVISIICLLSCTFRPIQSDIDHSDYNHECKDKFLDTSILTNKSFVIYTTAATVIYLGHYIPAVHMVRYCEELGFPERQASRLYICSGLGSLLVRPVIGRLHDVKWIKPCFIYSFVGVVEGVATFLLPLARAHSHFVVYFVLYGFTDGTMGCGLAIAILNCLSEKQRPLGFGLYQCITSIVSAAGPALGGLVSDITGSYVPVFYMVGTLAVIGAAMILMVVCTKNTAELKDVGDGGTGFESLIIVEKCSVV